MKSSKGYAKKGLSGLTLMELSLWIAVLGLVLPSLFYYFFSWRGGLGDTRLRSLAAQISQDLMEEIASKKWDENRGSGPVPDSSRTLPAALGPEAGESRYVAGVLSFDDVDDYHGLSESPPKDSQGNNLAGVVSFTRTAEVFYVDSPDLDAQVVAGPTNYKRVRVTVSWPGGGNLIDLVSIFSNR